ncbi:MAG TPA: MFS transporter [Caulobacteraceae bacterium]|nr:MFS transporter [Caulobacteraceae bacterium]
MTTIAPSHAPDAAAAPARDLFGHPRGLMVLAASEFWERFSFNGMQALLTLYMVSQLLLPGHVEKVVGFAPFRALIEGVTGPLSTQALGVQIFGVYVFLTSLTPIVGGWLGDQVFGRRFGVTLGALLMTAGHLCMAFDQSFLLALLLLTLGTGSFGANLTPQVGDLYARDDRRRAVAFQVYSAALSGASFLAPVVMGGTAQGWGYHAGFAIAAVGMVIGLVAYLAGLRALPSQARRPAGETRPRLSRAQWQSVLLLVALTPLAATFWVSQSQIWNTYNLWVRDHLQLHVGGFVVPIPWLQALDSLSPFISLPPMLWWWARQARRGREPDEFGKVATGCFIFAAATLWLGAGQFVTDAGGKTPLIWAVVFHFVSNLGWLYFAPTFKSLLSRNAPASVTGVVLALSAVAVSIGGLVSGRIGGLYETLEPWLFWTIHAAITIAGGALFLLVGATFRERLRQAADEHDAAVAGRGS